MFVLNLAGKGWAEECRRPVVFVMHLSATFTTEKRDKLRPFVNCLSMQSTLIAAIAQFLIRA